MSAVAAEPVEDGEAPLPPPKTGRKKLIITIAAALLALAAIGGVATFIIKKRAAAAGGDDEHVAHLSQAEIIEEARKHPPTFLPLDPFVVNLADRESERFAQIGITLELDDPKFADDLKTYMPAIRNGILMVLAHKNSQQLLGRAGKEALAAEIMREAVRPLGLEIEDEPPEAAKEEDDEVGKPAKPKAPRKPVEHNPVRHVHFSSFIVQ